MIGRLYTWRGQTWRVLVRWAPPARDMLTAVCEDCGSILVLGGYDPIPFCKCGGHPFEMQPSRRVLNTAPRNVLIERVIRAHGYAHGPGGFYDLIDGEWFYLTHEFVVRPFRGLRRLTP